MLESDGTVRSRWRLRIAWTLQVALAAVFVFTASRKFMGHPVPVATVEALGAGQWLRIAIGVAELAGAIGLLVPRLAGLAASCLALLMLGAVGTHLLVVGGSAVPALVLLAASAAVASLRGWRP
jgi:putative oxidoreductase